MKRVVAILAGLLVLPAFAGTATPTEITDTVFADDVADADYDEGVVSDGGVVQPGRAQQSGTRSVRAASARTLSGARTTAAQSSRGVASRSGGVRATNTPQRGVASRGVARTATTTGRTGVATTTPKDNVARAATVQTVALSGKNTVTSDAGDSRIGIRSQVGARVPSIRISSGNTSITTTPTVKVTPQVPTVTTITTAIEQVDDLAQLTDYCKAQYVACMDNFCNVLDDNEGRCSCSANLARYAQTEKALKEAASALQDVAQKLQYIGLDDSDIDVILTQTAAELEMEGTTDKTKLYDELQDIKNLILATKTNAAQSASSGVFGDFDWSGLLSFSFSSTGFDLSAFFRTNTSANTASINNQHGEQLYKTASARCKAAVLNACAAKGVDTAVISNGYDLEIDKHCLLYERSLNDANDNMRSTVRNATAVLQRARLMIEKQKNEYDMAQCIRELDNCMQDDFVCGTDYEYCLDPTGKYISNDGVVLGSMPGVPGGGIDAIPNSNAPVNYAASGLYRMWNFGNNNSAWGHDSGITEYISQTLSSGSLPNKNPTTLVEYLQNKIGWVDKDGNNMGLCMPVLNKCQDYVYTTKGNKKTFNQTNPVISKYLENVLPKIKVAQDTILADYATSCISDVTTCLTQNGYEEENVNSVKSRFAIGVCSSVIRTCRSVNGDCEVLSDGEVSCTDKGRSEWVAAIVVHYPDTVANITTRVDCLNAGCLWTGSFCTTDPHMLTTRDACEDTSLGLTAAGWWQEDWWNLAYGAADPEGYGYGKHHNVYWKTTKIQNSSGGCPQSNKFRSAPAEVSTPEDCRDKYCEFTTQESCEKECQPMTGGAYTPCQSPTNGVWNGTYCVISNDAMNTQEFCVHNGGRMIYARCELDSGTSRLQYDAASGKCLARN